MAKHKHQEHSPACHGGGQKKRIDFLLWGSLLVIVGFYGLFWLTDVLPEGPLLTFGESVFNLMNTMSWGMALAIIFVGLLSKIPREFVSSIMGRGGSFSGLVRAALAGLFLDLCSHGILIVGAKLYERGASAGQLMAFLIASPWNSLSLTFILIALIGLKWTLLFIVLSMAIAIVTGVMFDALVRRKILPANANKPDLPENFKFFPEAKKGLKATKYDGSLFKEMALNGLKGSRMVLRWIFFGVVLASVVRVLINPEMFQTWFGPTLLGLGLTVLAATIIEICSEGSTPIAADLVTRAGAPGNGFTFLMAGVATDYTEVMVIRETSRSWKLALFLPLLTVPQVVVLGYIMNVYG
jgi:uncharacterized membrane protein YraQ (UPF0718 family)